MNTWDKCQNCGGEQGLHHYKTMQCPVGGRESPIGREQEWMETRFQAKDESQETIERLLREKVDLREKVIILSEALRVSDPWAEVQISEDDFEAQCLHCGVKYLQDHKKECAWLSVQFENRSSSGYFTPGDAADTPIFSADTRYWRNSDTGNVISMTDKPGALWYEIDKEEYEAQS